MTLALTLAVAIGFTLALLGSGGSIITLPVLVYAAGVPVASAVGMSLGIVGATSLVGGLVQHRRGLVHWPAAALFGVSGMIGAVAGAQFTPLVSPAILMLLFGALMLVIAMRMLSTGAASEFEPAPDCRPVRCALAGLGVGVLTGFLGVGGGFLIVPAMVVFARLPIKVAAGTSLMVIAASSFAGLVAQIRHATFDWSVAGLFLIAALVGMGIGLLMNRQIPAASLRRGFGWFVLAVAVFVIVKNSLPFLAALTLNKGRT